MPDLCVIRQAESTMHGSGESLSPGGSMTTGPAFNLNRGGLQSSFRSAVSDTEVDNLQVTFTLYLNRLVVRLFESKDLGWN